jgi:hypothetical protein
MFVLLGEWTMWFNFFKRSTPPAPKPKQRRASKSKPDLDELPTQPSAQFEVTEGSAHSDWALWENSVASMDSRVQSMSPSVKLYRKEADEIPTEFQDVEAWATVKKKDP